MRAPRNRHLRAAIEVGFIVFLFYSNLLMGEFTRTAGRSKSLGAAILDLLTLKIFLIALVTSAAGHVGFESLRQKADST